MLRSSPRLLFLLCFFLPGIKTARGQADSMLAPGKWNFGISLHTGFIIAHRPAMVHLQKEHSSILELSLLRSASGEKDWHHHYNFPLYGVGYRYFNFGNPEELGRGHALYSQLLFPLLKKNRLRLGIRFGLGVGYVEKPFNIEKNYKNLAIGSRINGTLTTGLQFRVFTSKRLQVQTGLDFFHFSNGAAKLPNLGINLPSIYAGISYFEGKPEYKRKADKSDEKRKNELTATLAFGLKEKYPPEGPSFFISVLHAQYHFAAGKKGLLGGGAEFIVDESLPVRLEEDDIDGGFLDGALRAGVFGSAGIRLGAWDGHLQTGYYLYNKMKEDGFIYSRLLMRFHFHPSLFASFGLKTHFGRADYFEWGIGYRFR
ncbi:MAG: acyloxyacyl hydrolase [Bacteroidia bacterium]|nr:acyloxyacyl hydrolase [Bacteroidia bacterium]